MDENLKEVNFFKYCKTCKHKDKEEFEYPCDDCLNVEDDMREGTEKPKYYEEKIVNAANRNKNTGRTRA